MLVTDIGYVLAGLTAMVIIVIGARFLIAPAVAAAGFGIAAGHDGGNTDPYLSVKGVRDIASGLPTACTAQRPSCRWPPPRSSSPDLRPSPGIIA